MKSHRSRDRRRWSLIVWGILAGLLMLAVGAASVSAAALSYVPNQYIVKAVSGTTIEGVSQALAQVGGTVVKPLPLPDTYLVNMGKVAATTRSRRLGTTFAAATRWPIQAFYPNYVKHLGAAMVQPNDPFFGQQWGMGQINMPKAWAIEKGSASVTVAVIDTGVGNHPDLVDRIVQGYDYVDNDADPSNDTVGHGTFVAGIISAQGDNGMGVCGVCWNGVNIMPLRIFDEAGTTTDRILNALQYAIDNHADVVNMSYGMQGTDDLEHAKIVEAADAGLILVASAGNDGESGFPDTETPAAYQEVIAVSAVGPNDEFAPYSSWGPNNEIDIAAPGGDSDLGQAAYMFSTTITWPNGTTSDPVFGYDRVFTENGLTFPAQGTSFSAPHVAGAAALLLSAGVPATEVRDRLTSSARKPRTGSMDVKKYGAGILDVSAAMTSGSVLISKPVKGSTVTDNPDFKITARGITFDTLNVYLDYADGNQDDIPDDLTSEVPVLGGRASLLYLNAAHTAYLFNWSKLSTTPLTPGLHFIYVTATTSAGDTVSDWGTFMVSSNVIPRGTYLISLPYGSTLSPADGLRHPLPQQLLWDASTSSPLDFRTDSSGRAKLIRWSTLEGQYLYYLPGADNLPSGNDRSWVNLISPTFNAPTGGGYIVGDQTKTLQYPAGSGFWLILQQDAVLSNEFPVIAANAGLSIPLYAGWNLIGNPFTHQVALSTIKLTYHGQTRTLDDDLNAKNPWLQRPAPPKSQFYGYTAEGIPGYQAVLWRDILEPYKGYWVRALVGGNLPQDRLLITLQ